MEQMNLHMESTMGAIFSDDRTHRYDLWRVWERGSREIVFIGLNPSTADESKNDPTIRKCCNFAKLWRYNKMHMLNIFAHRATMPLNMKIAEDPIGPANNEYILRVVEQSQKRRGNMVVLCWGSNGEFMGRGREVYELVNGLCVPKCINICSNGEPGHPLYLPYETNVVVFKGYQNGKKGND